MWYPSGTGRTQKLLEQMIFDGHEVQVIEKFGGPPETRTPDPLIKSQTRATLHPTPNYCSGGKQKPPMVAFVAVRTDCTDTKRTQLETVPVPPWWVDFSMFEHTWGPSLAQVRG